MVKNKVLKKKDTLVLFDLCYYADSNPMLKVCRCNFSRIKLGAQLPQMSQLQINNK